MASLTTTDLFTLKDLEQRLVELGVARFGDDAQFANLVAAGYVSAPGPGVVVLTTAGWRVAHALREHIAATREQTLLTGVMPPFAEPAPVADDDERRDLARDIFLRTVAARSVAHDAAADEALSAAAAFIARRKAVGL